MDVEESLKRSKTLYKWFLITLKFLPFLLSFFHVLNSILSFFDIDLVILSYIAGVSFLPLVFMYLAAYVFGFCFYHRVFLHYIVLNNLINIYDYYIGIPVTDSGLLIIQLALLFIALVGSTLSYLKHKQHDYTTANK